MTVCPDSDGLVDSTRLTLLRVQALPHATKCAHQTCSTRLRTAWHEAKQLRGAQAYDPKKAAAGRSKPRKHTHGHNGHVLSHCLTHERHHACRNVHAVESMQLNRAMHVTTSCSCNIYRSTHAEPCGGVAEFLVHDLGEGIDVLGEEVEVLSHGCRGHRCQESKAKHGEGMGLYTKKLCCLMRDLIRSSNRTPHPTLLLPSSMIVNSRARCECF